jgi:hypothetical protein
MAGIIPGNSNEEFLKNQRRQTALAHAVAIFNGRSSDHVGIVKAAKAFEAYLAGEKSDSAS